MEHYETIAIFTYQSEYAILRLLLEQENLRFVFQNETMISVLPFHSNALGGIRLKVHPEDKDLALEILEKWKGSSHLKIIT